MPSYAADVNDITPSFVTNPYHVTVSESQAVGGTITTVTADDDDDGNAGEILILFISTLIMIYVEFVYLSYSFYSLSVIEVIVSWNNIIILNSQFCQMRHFIQAVISFIVLI